MTIYNHFIIIYEVHVETHISGIRVLFNHLVFCVIYCQPLFVLFFSFIIFFWGGGHFIVYTSNNSFWLPPVSSILCCMTASFHFYSWVLCLEYVQYIKWQLIVLRQWNEKQKIPHYQSEKYHTIRTVLKSNRKIKNTTLSEQF